MEESNIKICPCCGEEKELAAFGKDKSTKDGKYCYCRACAKIKRQKYSPEQQLEWSNRWREKHGDHVRKKGRERYAANPEAGRKKQKDWRDENRERLAETWKDNRRRVTLASYGLTPEQYEALLVSQQGLCAICETDDPQHWSGKFQVDHAH